MNDDDKEKATPTNNRRAEIRIWKTLKFHRKNIFLLFADNFDVNEFAFVHFNFYLKVIEFLVLFDKKRGEKRKKRNDFQWSTTKSIEFYFVAPTTQPKSFELFVFVLFSVFSFVHRDNDDRVYNLFRTIIYFCFQIYTVDAINACMRTQIHDYENITTLWAYFAYACVVVYHFFFIIIIISFCRLFIHSLVRSFDAFHFHPFVWLWLGYVCSFHMPDLNRISVYFIAIVFDFHRFRHSLRIDWDEIVSMRTLKCKTARANLIDGMSMWRD